MGNRMQAKMQVNAIFNILNTLQVVGIIVMAGVAQLVELWIVIPMSPSDISDLSPKTVWTSVDISSKCRQSVDKMWTNRKERHGKI